MDECGLSLKDLASALGVSIDRAKSLSSGRVQKLARQEAEALATRLRIRPEWIISDGQGPMFMTQREHSAWLAANALPAQLSAEIYRAMEPHAAWPDSGPPRSVAEAQLLDDWRHCDKPDRQMISDLAARLAKH